MIPRICWEGRFMFCSCNDNWQRAVVLAQRKILKGVKLPKRPNPSGPDFKIRTFLLEGLPQYLSGGCPKCHDQYWIYLDPKDEPNVTTKGVLKCQ